MIHDSERRSFARPIALRGDYDAASYIAGGLTVWLEEKGMDHVRVAPLHPQPQGKIERWH